MDRAGFEFSLEEMGKGRRRFGIIHAFIKGNVLGSLDLACLKILIICMLQRLLVSQDDPRTSMHINFGITRLSRKGIDTAAKCAKERKIGLTASAQFECRCSAIAMWKTIQDEQKMVQDIWPVFWLQLCTEKHCMHTINNEDIWLG